MSAIDRLNEKIESLYPGSFNPDFIYTVLQYDFMQIEKTLQARWIVQDWCEYQLRTEYSASFFNRQVTVGIDWAEFMPEWSPNCN